MSFDQGMGEFKIHSGLILLIRKYFERKEWTMNKNPKYLGVVPIDLICVPNNVTSVAAIL
jgi:hypothetical protein